MTAGCGNSDADSDVSKVDTINFNDVIDANMEENSSNHQDDEEESTSNQSDNSVENEDSQQNNNENLVQQSSSDQSQADSELDGNIESIGNNSIVLNKTFHPSLNVAVAYGDSDKVLVTVYLSEETKFEVWTVKNSGVNGDSDIDKREGTFSDIKEELSVKLTGDYEGNDFYAKQVIIYNFV